MREKKVKIVEKIKWCEYSQNTKQKQKIKHS